jgi:hypothetical protein
MELYLHSSHIPHRENRVLPSDKGTMFFFTRSSCLKMDEVTQALRKLHNEELNDLYSSPDIVQVIKSRRMRWAGNAACIE